MFLILLILIVPLLVYLVRAQIGENSEFKKGARKSQLIFISLTCLFLFLLLIEKTNHYLIGYRSTSIIYLVVTASAISYVLIDRRIILNSFKRIVLNIIAVIFMMGSSFLIIELIDDYNKQMVYSDSKFRIEFTGRGFMSICELPALFVKSGVVEQKCKMVTDDTCISKADILRVYVNDVDSCFLVKYFLSNKFNDANPKQLTVMYAKP